MKGLKILSYSLYDLIRSRWIYIYLGFYLIITMGLFAMSPEPTKVIISLLNVVLVIAPLMAVLITTMYYYNSRDFLEFLLAQPISRTSVVLGIYGGICTSLIICVVLGILIPALFFGIITSDVFGTFATLILMGSVLSCIFCGLALWIAMKNENRIQGFGLAILVWLLLALVYDGIVLLLLLQFNDYPLEKFALLSMMCNPIDLARTNILMKLDISALMGYTGAVIQKFYQGWIGTLVIVISLFCWLAVPLLCIYRLGNRKDW